MGIFDFLKALVGDAPVQHAAAPPAHAPAPAAGGLSSAALAARLGVSVDELRSVRIEYREFKVKKRSGGTRDVVEPAAPLKRIQRLVATRVLDHFKVHEAATAYRRTSSIATNAAPHVGAAVVVNLDIQDFFGATRRERVMAWFSFVGFAPDAAELLATLCTYRGALPQGAPTSPALSNLLNYRLDVRLQAAAKRHEARYTRYADDMTFSLVEDAPAGVRTLVSLAKKILAAEGYKLHHRKKLHVRRRHHRQLVTGLVVNERLALPRERRRWLRAVAHHLVNGKPATIDGDQLKGWASFLGMIERADAHRAR